MLDKEAMDEVLARVMTRRRAISTSAKVGAAVVATAVVAGGLGYYGGLSSGGTGTGTGGTTQTQTLTQTQTQTVTQTKTQQPTQGLSGSFTYLDIEGSRFSTAHDAVSKVFATRYPSVKLVPSPQSLQAWFTNTGVQLASGSPKFDYFEMLYQDVPGWAAAGYLEPLDDYIKSNDPSVRFTEVPDLGTDIPQNYLDVYKFKGKQYSIPADISVKLYYYRRDLLESKNINPPTNWDDVLNIAKTFHNPPDMYGIAMEMSSPNLIMNNFITIMFSYGGDFFDEKFVPQLNTDAATKALDTLVKLFQYDVAGFINKTENDTYIAISVTGDAVQTGPLSTNAAIQDPGVSKFANVVDAAVQPAGTVSSSLGLGVGQGIWSKSSSESKLAAWLYERFQTSKEGLLISAENTGSPTRLSVLTAPEFMKDHKFQFYQFLAKGMFTAKFIPQVPEWGTIDSSIMSPTLSKVVSGQLSQADALSQMQSKVKDLMQSKGYYS